MPHRTVGVHPRALVEPIMTQAPAAYQASLIDQATGRLAPLVIPEEGPFWFNAVFVPAWLEDPVAAVSSQVSALHE